MSACAETASEVRVAEIVRELSELGITPSKLHVLARAGDLGLPEVEVEAIANAFAEQHEGAQSRG